MRAVESEIHGAGVLLWGWLGVCGVAPLVPEVVCEAR